MRAVWLALAVLLTFLAGCSEVPSDVAGDSLVSEEEFEDYTATDTTGVIRGVVIDDAIRPVQGALITLALGAEGARNATSSESGAFGFADLEPGTYFMQVSKPGYNSVQASADVVAGEDEPALVKVLLALNPDERPYFTVVNWNGYIECSFRVAVPGVTSLGVNACNGVGNQDVNFPLAPMDAVPSFVQAELIWENTQPTGSGLSFVVGPPDCRDLKYNRADGESPLVIRMNDTEILADSEAAEDEGFVPESGICYRAFSYVSGTSGGSLGLVTSQQFDAFYHIFYNMLPPEGWQFSLDGDPPQP